MYFEHFGDERNQVNNKYRKMQHITLKRFQFFYLLIKNNTHIHTHTHARARTHARTRTRTHTQSD